MSFRFETHENVIMKAKFSNLTWEQASKYGFYSQLKGKNVAITEVRQEGDKLIITKRINKAKNVWYRWGFD